MSEIWTLKFSFKDSVFSSSGYIWNKGGHAMFSNILLPVDGSETCAHVFKKASEFHNKFGSKIILVHVDESTLIQNYVNYPMPNINITIDGTERSSEILKSARDKLDIPDDYIKEIVLTGEPASAILDAATQENADLILICTHGMGAARRFLLGSVTNRVVHHADIPVLIVQQD